MEATKLKLTEDGARALKAWMARSSVTLVELGEAVPGAHPMAVSRWIKRQGLLTLEQLGHLVAYSCGELTAEMLVGRERASGVPTYPPRQRPGRGAVQVERPAAGAPRAASAVDASEDDGPPSIEELRRLGRKGLTRLEAVVDDEGSATTAAAEAAYRLVKNWIAAEELEREKEKAADVTETDLIAKFETLLFHARRRAEELEQAESAGEIASEQG